MAVVTENPFASINRKPCLECGGPMSKGNPRCAKCRDDRQEESRRATSDHVTGHRVATWLTPALHADLKRQADDAGVPLYQFIRHVLERR